MGSVCNRGVLITKSGTVDQDTCYRLWVVRCVDCDVTVCGCVYVDVCLYLVCCVLCMCMCICIWCVVCVYVYVYVYVCVCSCVVCVVCNRGVLFTKSIHKDIVLFKKMK